MYKYKNKLKKKRGRKQGEKLKTEKFETGLVISHGGDSHAVNQGTTAKHIYIYAGFAREDDDFIVFGVHWNFRVSTIS